MGSAQKNRPQAYLRRAPTLAKVKITHTEIYRFSIPMEPFTIATGTMSAAQNVLIKLFTDTGLFGWGECSAFPYITGETQDTCLVMAREFAAMWKGREAADIAARMQELDAVAARNYTIKSGFDMALYDLNAKAAGVPLYRFLGGEKRPVETDITIGIGTADEMAAKAQEFEASGARILKVKIGKNAWEDVEKIARIRQVIKADTKIRVDANQGWAYEDAVFALQALDQFDVEFCEQPMRTWYDDYLPELCHNAAVNIMADESCYHSHDARRLIKAGACDSINIKLAKSGGIFEALKMNEIALQAGIPCMIGGMLESRLAVTANLHLAWACNSVQYYDLDTCLLGHKADPVMGGAVYNQFFLDCGDEPGIGADIDSNFLKSCEMIRV